MQTDNVVCVLQNVRTNKRYSAAWLPISEQGEGGGKKDAFPDKLLHFSVFTNVAEASFYKYLVVH